MKVVLFDGNIYNKLTEDPMTCETIRRRVAEGKMKILVSRTIAEELTPSPFQGIPELFPYEYTSNSVPLAGAMRAGDSLGDAEVFHKHLGKSQKVNDALIADTAACKADWLVTEDYRLRRHLEKHQNRCNGMTYEYFLEELNAIQ